VPFDATDPSAPEQKSKERPALVVAASADSLLVRPIYSAKRPDEERLSGVASTRVSIRLLRR